MLVEEVVRQKGKGVGLQGQGWGRWGSDSASTGQKHRALESQVKGLESVLHAYPGNFPKSYSRSLDLIYIWKAHSPGFLEALQERLLFEPSFPAKDQRLWTPAPWWALLKLCSQGLVATTCPPPSSSPATVFYHSESSQLEVTWVTQGEGTFSSEVCSDAAPNAPLRSLSHCGSSVLLKEPHRWAVKGTVGCPLDPAPLPPGRPTSTDHSSSFSYSTPSWL